MDRARLWQPHDLHRRAMDCGVVAVGEARSTAGSERRYVRSVEQRFEANRTTPDVEQHVAGLWFGQVGVVDFQAVQCTTVEKLASTGLLDDLNAILGRARNALIKQK